MFMSAAGFTMSINCHPTTVYVILVDMPANRSLRLILSFLITSALLAAPAPSADPADPQAVPSAAPRKPRLVLAVVIDQFRYDYLLRFRTAYHSGLARLLEKGAVFTDAHYIHATTITAVGHSTFLTGAPPSVSGIIGNSWYDRQTGASVTSVSDASTKMVGGKPDAAGSSPRRLLVSTEPDEVKMQGAESKTIGISIKDRAAILPSGHMADGAYWYDSGTSNWVTSTYYRPQLPEWVQKVNTEHPARRFAGARWLPFDAKDQSAPPFCTMARDTAVRFCGELEATPWANEMIEDLAERAIVGENLGHHAGVDFLTVSFSANDYVGHAVGPDDPAVRDISIRTDILLGKLFDFVDQRAGAGNTLIVLTADHGVAPVPEVNLARHMPGGRLDSKLVNSKITEALTARFGPGEWLIPGSPATMPYLNLKLVSTLKLNLPEVELVAANAAAGVEHIARVYTAQQLASGAVQQDAISRAFSLSFYGPRAGNLFILQEPYYLFDATGTSHGVPYAYDNHVPVLFLGPGIKPGTYAGQIAVNDIAPTLAALLGTAEPSGSIGRVLSEMFP
jgi:predicted AlkP superfamily pyrophosphatase or phosphodiesterase